MNRLNKRVAKLEQRSSDVIQKKDIMLWIGAMFDQDQNKIPNTKLGLSLIEILEIDDDERPEKTT